MANQTPKINNLFFALCLFLNIPLSYADPLFGKSTRDTKENIHRHDPSKRLHLLPSGKQKGLINRKAYLPKKYKDREMVILGDDYLYSGLPLISQKYPKRQKIKMKLVGIDGKNKTRSIEFPYYQERIWYYNKVGNTKQSKIYLKKLKRMMVGGTIYNLESLGGGQHPTQKAIIKSKGRAVHVVLKTHQVDRATDINAECAAWEIDQLLKIGSVPMTIERVISGRRYSVQVFIHGPQVKVAKDLPKKYHKLGQKETFFDYAIRQWDRGPSQYSNPGNYLFYLYVNENESYKQTKQNAEKTQFYRIFETQSVLIDHSWALRGRDLFHVLIRKANWNLRKSKMPTYLSYEMYPSYLVYKDLTIEELIKHVPHFEHTPLRVKKFMERRDLFVKKLNSYLRFINIDPNNSNEVEEYFKTLPQSLIEQLDKDHEIDIVENESESEEMELSIDFNQLNILPEDDALSYNNEAVEQLHDQVNNESD